MFCQQPASITSNPRSLLEMPCGRSLRVDFLTGASAERSRLYALGFLPGTEITLCHPSNGTGCIRVKIKQCLLVLEASMAKHILCRPACEEKPLRAEHGRLRQHQTFSACSLPVEKRHKPLLVCGDSTSPACEPDALEKTALLCAPDAEKGVYNSF